MIRKISSAYAGGVAGALAAACILWVLNRIGFTALIGVGLSPGFHPAWLYPRLTWGGVSGLLLMLPVMQGRVIQRGMFMSLAPTAILCFVTFPDMGKGFFGTGYGLFTPFLVLAVDLFWGITASFWYERGR